MPQRLQQTKHALGCDIAITLCAEEPAANDIFTECWLYVEHFEQQFSRFKAESELSHFNARAGSWQIVQPSFGKLLEACQQYSRHTHGLFNPFILPKLQLAGYRGSWPNPSQAEPNLDLSGRRLHAPQELQIEAQKARIPATSALDFGGIGKGYALDALAQRLLHAGLTDFWISLGGDIICHGFDTDGSPWSIGIEVANKSHPVEVANKHGELLAIATSGVTKRQGQGWHHIIDPRSGKPAATNVLTATVVAPLGVTADIYAKALVIDDGFSPDTTAPPLLASYVQYRDGSTRKQDTGGHFI